MSDLPLLAIGLLTYKRTREALVTLESTMKNLIYPNRAWYIGDDGSPSSHMDALLDSLTRKGETLLGYHNEKFSPGTYHCGKGWNKTLGICHQASDFVLWIEDDWELETVFDLRPYVKLLMDREEVGICSFRILSVGADLHTIGHDGIVYLQYERNTQYAYSGNPYLRHARYTKKYGWFAEDRNPGLIELYEDDKYRLAMEGPRIWRPATISIWGPWGHIGSNKTWE